MHSGEGEACPVGGERPLASGEIALARTVFGNAVDYGPVRIKRRKWFPFQPVRTVMAPNGHLHFHPRSRSYCADFSRQALGLQGLFIHEMTHVWQTQTRGDWYLVLNRPFSSRYDYTIRPGWPLNRYGIEQQAEIVRHAFLLRNGGTVTGIADPRIYDALVDFPGAG